MVSLVFSVTRVKVPEMIFVVFIICFIVLIIYFFIL